MLRFQKLRLTGFKSFVDSTELRINDGLTGVVGPNGCGKSNLVEALRWVMGETSAKQMRGSEMEDVIFAGTRERPGRNIAEVVLTLDNKERQAPAQFNDADELEVSRKIERDKGSTYRVNGREVRARDVQLLFADQSTGARSTAMVSQGRVGAVINAKPAQRRLLLEEAAGITGLHSRRHEAELRLRGAETNLERLDDILGALEVQMNSLRKQARQASRYRNLSDHIRTAEAALFHLRWVAAEETRSKARAALKQATEEVNRSARLAAEASTLQAAASAGLPELRDAETGAAAELQRLNLARESLDAEEARLAGVKRDREQRIQEADRDMTRETALLSDADAAIERLGGERAELQAHRDKEKDALKAAEAALRAAADAVSELDRDVSRLTEEAASGAARQGSLERRVGDLSGRLERLNAHRERTEAERAQLENRSADLVELAEAEKAAEETAAHLEAARSARADAETVRVDAVETGEAAVQAEREARNALTALEAETGALRGLLSVDDGCGWKPVLEDITADPGFEEALGVALGDDLNVPADDEAPVHWRSLPPLSAPPSLPAGVTALGEAVRAPEPLRRRLSLVGVCADAETAANLQASLKSGQRLVTRDGGLWRWDGLTVHEGAETAAAKRLAQKNKLADLEELLAEKSKAYAAVREKAEAAQTKARSARQDEEAARSALREADAAFNRARDHLSRTKDKAQTARARLGALTGQAERLNAEISETGAQLTEARTEFGALPDMARKREELVFRRAVLSEKRSDEAAAQSRHAALERDAKARLERLDAIGRERASWESRKSDAREQQAALAARRARLVEELDALEAKPAEIAGKRSKLLSAIETSEQKRKGLADKLADAEGALRGADQALRTAEARLAQAREQRVRAEGAVEQADQAVGTVTERVRERLQLQPEGLFAAAELREDAPLPELRDTERKVERLNRERDTMGPVNLRADEEMRELAEQMESLDAEKADLIAAISRLRQGISEINREGRARLLASFEEVNDHFKQLFVTLFGGGEAHLELVESDDPLEAGLEILASPPGKKMRALSLLSGGEQALTAIALLFAVFQTNPAPICVLDEVDAPLDDANVDRFCKMLESMIKQGATRFLIITHHRMTMARMQRLFGVTMQERGVSQLVSVDLDRAASMRAAG